MASTSGMSIDGKPVYLDRDGKLRLVSDDSLLPEPKKEPVKDNDELAEMDWL